MSNWLDLNSQHFLPILHNIPPIFMYSIFCALVQNRLPFAALPQNNLIYPTVKAWYRRLLNYKSRNSLFKATMTATNSNLPNHMPTI